jgi:transcriptional/translational regulatory protein YebC/TACO1
MVPKNTVEVTEEKPARALIKLLDNLEDHDDVQKVHANFDIPDEIMEQLS